jgi:hypothetical protein
MHTVPRILLGCFAYPVGAMRHMFCKEPHGSAAEQHCTMMIAAGLLFLLALLGHHESWEAVAKWTGCYLAVGAWLTASWRVNFGHHLF